MAKKATKKKATKKVVKKSAVDKRVEDLKGGTSIHIKRLGRSSISDVINRMPEDMRTEFSPATSARNYRLAQLFTGIIDFDLFCGATFGKRIQLQGDPNYGKSLLTYVIAGAMQNTCRRCFTPIIPWINDGELLAKGEEVTPDKLRTKETCRCGRNERMAVMFIDAEDCFDPYWANIWGLRVSTSEWENYNDFDIEEEEGEDGGTIWRGMKISPDGLTIIVRPTSSKTIETMTQEMIKSGAVDCVIIDSLAAFATEEDLEGKERLGSRARFLSRFFPLLLSAQLTASKDFGARVTFVATNQYRQGPVANPRANPNKAAGGMAAKYQSDQVYQIVSSRVNDAIPDGYKQRVVMRDLTVRPPKAKVAGSGGGEAQFRLYLDDYAKSEKLTFSAGDTNEPEKLYDYMQQLDDPRVFEVEKTKGGSTKGYKVLGREFKRVKDIVDFLRRPDIQFLMRFLIFARFMPVSGRLHLRADNFDYSPFPHDPAIQLIKEMEDDVGEGLRKKREGIKIEKLEF